MGDNMPLRKRKSSQMKKFGIMLIVAIIIILMIMYIEPIQHVTEVVLS